MTEHEAFLEWFNERENYSLRSDRFYEEASHKMDLLPWLQAAFSMGARYEREACIDLVAFYGGLVDLEAAIRARGQA
jgi:hypothetical protein